MSATPVVPGCEWKKKFVYQSEKAARVAARRMRRAVVDWFKLGTYYCEFHKGWHVGNRREKKR